jgi:hypothetical protein
MKIQITKKQKAVAKSYIRAVAGAAIAMGIALLTDLAPQYAVLLGALAAPAIKWADKTETEFGRILDKEI